MKKILYISRSYPNKLFNNLEMKTSIAASKYNNMLMEGLSKCSEVTNYGTFDCYFKSETHYQCNGIKYVFFPKLSLLKRTKLFKYFFIFFKNNNSVLIADYLNLSLSLIAILSAIIFKRKKIAIVTDLPEYIFNSRFKIWISYFILKRFDYYVVMTEQMKEKLPGKNSLIIEGLVNKIEKSDNNTHHDHIILYAGALDKKYGLDILIRSFAALDREDFELHIYGNGDFKDKIIEYSELNNRIKYFGVVDNDTILEKEKSAYLLVNPRPSNEEFTKYSFPSKNLEYMSTGTPMLCSNLPGMPDEYKKYIYIFEDETVEGLKNKMMEILNKDITTHFELGLEAKKFVEENKNCDIQAKKILNLIK